MCGQAWEERWGTSRLRPPASLLPSHRGSTSTSTPRPSVAMVTLLYWVLCRPPSSSAGWALSASLDRLQHQCLPTVIWLTHPSLFLPLITYTAGLTKLLIPPGNTKPKTNPKQIPKLLRVAPFAGWNRIGVGRSADNGHQGLLRDTVQAAISLQMLASQKEAVNSYTKA